jgi:hypothetical protein
MFLGESGLFIFILDPGCNVLPVSMIDEHFNIASASVTTLGFFFFRKLRI